MVLKLRMAAPDWSRGKCYGIQPPPGNDPWFDNTEEGYTDLTDEGVGYCNGTDDGVACPLREECLRFALVNNEKAGVWGGMKEADRRIVRKLWPWDPRNPAEPHPEWYWRPSEQLQVLYRKRFGKAAPPPEIEEDEDEDC